MLIVAVTRLVTVLISDTVPSWLTTTSVLPFGVIAMVYGSVPTVIGWPARLVAVEIGVTLSDAGLAAYTVLLSGVLASSTWPDVCHGEYLPTGIGIGLPGRLVAVRIGVTYPLT